MNEPHSHIATRAAGVREVATLAGVSRQTVSRVLNDHPEVAVATKKRVLQAMDELGYRMNNAARALSTRRSHTLGILASDSLLYGPSRSIAAIETSARAAGYWVSAAFVDVGDTVAVTAAVEHLAAQGVEGIVVVAPHSRTLQALDAMKVGVPVLTLHSAGHGSRGLSVDQVAGARLAVGALAEAGHVRIGHLSGPADWLEAESRAEGFQTELQSRALPVGPTFAGDWTARSGYESTAAVLDSRITAVFAANDQMALGLLSGLHAAGVAVPEEISVVGFDDIPDAAYYWPKLTTVRQDFEELARRAVAALIAGVDDPSTSIEPILVTRDSVAPPR